MNIKPINTSFQFSLKYVNINDIIFERSHAFNTYPEHKEEINNALKEAYKEPVINKFNYPSYDKMQEEINEKITSILNELNIGKTQKGKEQFYNAYKVFDYFAKNLQYSMVVMEERGLYFEDRHSYFKILKQQKNKLKELNLKPVLLTEQTKFRMEKETLYKEMAKEADDYRSIIGKKEMNYMKGLYNVIVRNVGICSDFAHAFNYVLEKIDIPTYKTLICINKENSVTYHAFSLVQIKDNNATHLYACDLTKALVPNYEAKKADGKVLGFGLGKKDILNKERELLSIQKQMRINEGSFCPELEEKIIEKRLSKELMEEILLLDAKEVLVEC